MTLDLDATLSSTTARSARGRARAAPTPARSPGTRCSASSARRASGCTRSCATATPPPRPAPTPLPRRVPAPPARRRRALFLRADEGFFGQDFLAELERQRITYTVGAPLIASVQAADRRDRRGGLAALELPRTAARSRASLAAEDLEAGAALRRPPRPARAGRAAHARRTASGTTGCSSPTTASAPPTSSSPGTAPRPTSRTESRRRSSASVSTTSPAAASTPTGPTCSVTLLAYNLLCLAEAARPPRERAAAATRSGCASASSPSPPPSAAPAAASSSASRAGYRSSPTSSARCTPSAGSRGRPPERLARPNRPISLAAQPPLNPKAKRSHSPTRSVEHASHIRDDRRRHENEPPDATSAPYRRIRVAIAIASTPARL